uniref:Uncharacterized protein n=1 Tax=Panagrolaimus sp. ES5 TaxID=591445 RepID=A0AC34F2A2_9BILA
MHNLKLEKLFVHLSKFAYTFTTYPEMALPYDGESEFGRQGAYQLSEHDEEVRAISVNQRTSSETTYAFTHPAPEEEEAPKESILPGCLKEIPKVIIVLLAILIVLFIIFSIPLVFALTQSAEQLSSTSNDGSNEVWLGEDGPNSRSENETISALAALLPPNVTMCRGMGFSCVSRPSVVVSTNSLCDGVADCPDGTDEVSCKECATSFSCSQSPNATTESPKLCLRARALHDGYDHCGDQSDENIMHLPQGGKCPLDKFKCSSMCLPKSFICDGEPHCPSGEDERNCEGKCQHGSKYCKTLKQCLPKWTLCNGVKDCDDGSDEDDCDCKQCSGLGKLICSSSPDKKGYCLNLDRVCDGTIDCPNGEDEEGCPGEMKKDEIEMVKCNDGKSYSKVYACLGLIPSCQGVCDECNKHSAFDCGNKHCILKSKVCDGTNDCPNGLDEKNCTCPTTFFKCPSKLPNGNDKCIEQNQRCDGFLDCPNGEDENGCEKCSNEDAFKCMKENKCISQTARCDGRKHCSDGSDEEDCSLEKCAIHPLSMYMCSDKKNCFRKDEICSPYSKCPKPSAVDKGYCAVLRKASLML